MLEHLAEKNTALGMGWDRGRSGRGDPREWEEGLGRGFPCIRGLGWEYEGGGNGADLAGGGGR